MIKGVIFDCFGVLVTDSLDAILAHYEPDEATSTAIWDVTRSSSAGLVSRRSARHQTAKLLGIDYKQLKEFYKKAEHRNTKLIAYIEYLQSEGYKTALLSNVGKGGLSERFSDEELKKYFNVVVESGAVGMIKPDVEIYEYTVNKLNLQPSECIMIDDRDNYCAGAEAAGLSTILFTDTHDCLDKLNKVLGLR